MQSADSQASDAGPEEDPKQQKGESSSSQQAPAPEPGPVNPSESDKPPVVASAQSSSAVAQSGSSDAALQNSDPPATEAIPTPAGSATENKEHASEVPEPGGEQKTPTKIEDTTPENLAEFLKQQKQLERRQMVGIPFLLLLFLHISCHPSMSYWLVTSLPITGGKSPEHFPIGSSRDPESAQESVGRKSK